MLQESNLGAFLICGGAVNRTFVRVATISWTGKPQTFFQKTLDKHLHLCYNNNRKKRKGQPKMEKTYYKLLEAKNEAQAEYNKAIDEGLPFSQIKPLADKLYNANCAFEKHCAKVLEKLMQENSDVLTRLKEC